MLKTFDYKCLACGTVEERMVRKAEADKQHCSCQPRGALMTRLPAGTRTTFRFADTKLKA